MGEGRTLSILYLRNEVRFCQIRDAFVNTTTASQTRQLNN